jgi:hypothetical protein
MNNKQWEEEFDLLFPDETTGFRKYLHYNADLCCESDNCYDNCRADKKRVIKQFISNLISQREAEIRKEQEDYIKDLEKSVEILRTKGKLDKQYFNEIRKETIKAVLPEEKDMPVADENFFIGYNTCRELIKDKAKSKFNITI